MEDLYATHGRKSVDTTDGPALEHVCGVADAGAVSRDGRHSHAMLFRPRQTSDPRLISTDAAVMMNGSASASFGPEIRRVNRALEPPITMAPFASAGSFTTLSTTKTRTFIGSTSDLRKLCVLALTRIAT
jgi:hypothetical protein